MSARLARPGTGDFRATILNAWRTNNRVTIYLIERIPVELWASPILLGLACDHDGRLPPTRAYVWRNLPLDVGHILTYFVAHEAHHRGQIVLVGRALGFRLPDEVTDGLWQWNRRSVE